MAGNKKKSLDLSMETKYFETEGLPLVLLSSLIPWLKL